MSSSCSSDDHLCSPQRPLNQSAQHSASGGRSFTSWPSLLGGAPLQVKASHFQGQLQCVKPVGPASSGVPYLLQAPPPPSVPPDHLGSLSGSPLASALGLTQASLGWQLSRSSSGSHHALPVSVRTMQTSTPRTGVGSCQLGLEGWSTGFPALDPHQQRGGSAVGDRSLSLGSQLHLQSQDHMAALAFQSSSFAGKS